jgi:general stress protein 26
MGAKALRWKRYYLRLVTVTPLLPEAAVRTFNESLVCEFTVLSKPGRPITHPLIPLFDSTAGKLYFTSSVLFSKKLERIKQNPKVSALFPGTFTISGTKVAKVLVQGEAKIIEQDVHHGWEKLMLLWKAKEPYIPKLAAQRFALPLFWERSVIELPPRYVYVWPNGSMDSKPEVYEN